MAFSVISKATLIGSWKYFRTLATPFPLPGKVVCVFGQAPPWQPCYQYTHTHTLLSSTHRLWIRRLHVSWNCVSSLSADSQPSAFSAVIGEGQESHILLNQRQPVPNTFSVVKERTTASIKEPGVALGRYAPFKGKNLRDLWRIFWVL